MKDKKFLSHVAGLRGLAIIAVLLFHFTQQSESLTLFKEFSYGYLGVDVFFVVMGYFLIKGFCVKEIIPPLHYAGKKLVRLLPVLVVVVLLTLLISLFFIDSKDLYNASHTGSYALYGCANVSLKKITTGYFSADALYNPFLHTWYLSVTLQLLFVGYLVYRVKKYLSNRLLMVLLGVVGVASFIYMHVNDLLKIFPNLSGVLTPNSPYYDTFPRVWEILAGGTILLLPTIDSTRVRSLLVIAALVCVVWLMLLTDASCYFAAVPVTVGTMLIIKYMPGTVLMPLLSNPVALWLGKISYSLYLVHVPLLVMYRLWFFENPSDAAIVVLLILSLLVGFGMWWCVEKRNFSWRTLLPVWGITLAFCLYGKKSKGFDKIVNSGIQIVDIQPTYQYNWQQEQDKSYAEGLDYSVVEPAFFSQGVNPEEVPPLKRIGDASVSPSFVLLGDSHMYHLGIALEHICHKEHVSGIMLDSIVVPFCNRSVVKQSGTPFYNYNRKKFHALVSWLEKHPEFKTIIIGQSWERFSLLTSDWDGHAIQNNSESEFIEFFAQLHKLERKIVVVEPTPVYRSSKAEEYMRIAQRSKMMASTMPRVFVCAESEYNKCFSQSLKLLPELEKMGYAHLIRVREHFFRQGESSNIQDGYANCYDKNHLTIPAAQKWGDYISPQVLPLIK